VQSQSVGFVGGGRITAILLQALGCKGLALERVTVSDTSAEVLGRLKSRFPAITTTAANTDAAACERVFLALHPPALKAVLPELAPRLRQDALVVSLAPVLTIERLSALLGGFGRIARVLPNAPSLVGAGFNPCAFSGDLPAEARVEIATLLDALGEHPGALASYAVGALVIVSGGAALTFLAKGGTVSVLVRAERHAPPVERPPLRLRTFQRAEVFGVHRYGDGARRLFRRYLGLGVLLAIGYAILGGTYLAVVLATYHFVRETNLVVGWTLIAAGLSGALVLAITVVNLLYLLVQLAVAFDDCSLRKAMLRVSGFLRAEYREVATVFAVMLGIVGLATAASILATASLGFIGFVPVVGLAVLPLQIVAFLLRGVVFQYIGLTALCAYVRLYRGSRTDLAPLGAPMRPATEPAS
jgi:hypothetical protein